MDFYEWICFFFIGIVCFLFIMGFFEAILMMDYTIYAKIPIALVACWVLLLSFRKFLVLYTRVRAKISATPQHDVKILLTGWGVSVLWNHHGELILPTCLSAAEDQLRHTEPTLRLAVVCRRRHW